MCRLVRWLVLLLAVAAAGCGGEGAPYGAPEGTAQTGEAGPSTRIRIATFNIRHGLGPEGKVDLSPIAAFVQSAAIDVLFLNEVDENWARSGWTAQAEELGRLSGLRAVYFAPALRTVFGAYGNALLSRLAWSSVRAEALPRQGHREPRNVVIADLPLGGEVSTLRILGTHLSTDREERRLQIEFLASQFPPSAAPALLLGDFNTTPDRTDFAPLLAAGWIDLWQQRGQGDGFTFPADAPRYRIDYILASPAAAAAVTRIEVVPLEASDHLPVVVELDVAALTPFF